MSSGGGAKKEVNTQTANTVLHETDLDAPEPLKSALKQSGEGGAAAPKQTEVVEGGEDSVTRDTTTTREDGTTHHHVGSDEQ